MAEMTREEMERKVQSELFKPGHHLHSEKVFQLLVDARLEIQQLRLAISKLQQQLLDATP